MFEFTPEDQERISAAYQKGLVEMLEAAEKTTGDKQQAFGLVVGSLIGMVVSTLAVMLNDDGDHAAAWVEGFMCDMSRAMRGVKQ